jgi:hypothetical protein
MGPGPNLSSLKGMREAARVHAQLSGAWRADRFPGWVGKGPAFCVIVGEDGADATGDSESGNSLNSSPLMFASVVSEAFGLSVQARSPNPLAGFTFLGERFTSARARSFCPMARRTANAAGDATMKSPQGCFSFSAALSPADFASASHMYVPRFVVP